MSEEVTLQEIIAQKEDRIRELEADKQQMALEIKLLKEKTDLLIRRLFGSKSEKLDLAQLELLLKEDEQGKADASAEKAEAAPSDEASKPVTKRSNKKQRRERWPKDLAVEQHKARAAQASADEELILASTELSGHEAEKRLGKPRDSKALTRPRRPGRKRA